MTVVKSSVGDILILFNGAEITLNAEVVAKIVEAAGDAPFLRERLEESEDLIRDLNDDIRDLKLELVSANDEIASLIDDRE